MLVSVVYQLGNSVSSQPEGHRMPLGNADWKMRGCRSLSVYLHFLHSACDASVKPGLREKASPS